jgi:hypothetical protein
MRTETVEIYSDATNSAVLRHPGRRFPGTLIQGDTQNGICKRLDSACAAAKGKFSPDDFLELNDLRNEIRAHLNHYKSVLVEHGIPMPFYETP